MIPADAHRERANRLQARVDELEAQLAQARRELASETAQELVNQLRVQLNVGPGEARLLERLMASPGRIIPRLTLLDAVACRDEVDWKIIDVHVCRLRKALAARGLGGAIETVWGAGYRLPAEAATRIAKGAPWDVNAPVTFGALRPAASGEKRGRLLRALSAGPKAHAELVRATGCRFVAATVGDCRRVGLVEAAGPHRQQVYRLTDAGRAWLAARETQGAAA